MSVFDAQLRLLLKNIFGSAAARGINLLITLLFVPLTVGALDTVDYAYLATAISLSMLTAYADLGMGLAVVNVIARRNEGGTNLRAKRAVSVVWFALIGFGFCGLLLTGCVAVALNFNQSEDGYRQINVMLMAMACIFAGLPSGLVQRILFAEQKNIEANVWATAGKLISLACVYFLARSESANIFYFVFAILGVPMLVSWGAVISLFLIKKTDIRPQRRMVAPKLFKKYVSLGVGYLILSIVPYVETGGDVLLLATFGYSDSIQSYDVYAKLFNYIPAFASILVFPIWPAIARAKAANNIAWVNRVQRFAYIGLVGFSMVLAVFFVVFGSQIILQWTGKNLILDAWVIWALGVFSVLMSFHLLQAMILNGLGKVRDQVLFYVKYLPIVVFLKILVLNFFGIASMIWVCNLLYLGRLYYLSLLQK